MTKKDYVVDYFEPTIVKMPLKRLEGLSSRAWNGVSLFTIRVEDKENNRFTDCWVSAFVKHNRVVFQITHEKGYPSQELGTITKSIIGSWVSNEIPSL